MPGPVAPFTAYVSAQTTEAGVARQERTRLYMRHPVPDSGYSARLARLNAAHGGVYPVLWHGRAVYSDAEWRLVGLG